MGLVFEATHKFMRRSVVVKLLAEELRRSLEGQRRLLREALALTTIRHPGFVEALDAGVCALYGPYVVLEMLDGRSLDGIIAARTRLTVADTVQVGRQVCDAVEHAHGRGIVHRDLKPSNFFVAKNEIGQETIKVIDLGVAAVAAEQLDKSDHKLTHVHQVLGTPEYMAPEQLTGRPVDARTDVYAVGVSLFECLTGEVPFPGTYADVLTAVMSAGAPPRVRDTRPEIPAAVAAVVERAIRKDAAERFQTAAELGHALVSASGVAPGHSELLTTASRASDDEIFEELVTADEIEIEVRRPIELTKKKGSPAAGPPPVPGKDTASRRRHHARAPYVTPTTLVGADAKEISARSEEISVGGMLLLSPAAFPDGASLRVRFATPVTGDIITLPALVRWSREARGRWVLGLEFADVPRSFGRVVTEFVQLFQTIG